MAGLYYDPSVHAWGKDLMQGVLTGMQMSQLSQGMKMKEKQQGIDAAQNQLTTGFKFLELAKGNPGTQKAIINKFVAPALKSLSKQGAVNYKDSDIDDFSKNLDFSNKNTQSLVTSLTGAFKKVQSGDMTWKEGQEFFDTSLMGYQGELGKLQISGIEGMQEQLKAGKKQAGEISLFTPQTETIPGVQPTQVQSQFGQDFQMPGIGSTKIREPSAFVAGLKKDYSPEQIQGMVSAIRSGTPLKDAIKMFPKGGEGDFTGEIDQFRQIYDRPPQNVAELKKFKEDLRLPPQTTVSERDILKRQKATEELTLRAQKDPNKVYAHGYKMNADRTLYIDPVDKAPVKLPHFTKVMGKRGGPKMAKAAGEFWDDTVEIQELLNDSEVIKNLQWAEKEGFWDRVKGSWSNKINLWLTKKGFSKDSKTTEAIVRMQRLASVERLKFLGSAVTATELESLLPWLPSAGDSFSTMTTKMGVAAKEGEEAFRRYLEMYQDICDMSPFYKAFGLKRFPDETNNIDALKSKYGLE